MFYASKIMYIPRAIKVRVLTIEYAEKSTSDFDNISCELQVFCSRYVNFHMLTHANETRHPVALSWSDLSVWCYSCDSYISSPLLEPLLDAAVLTKFA